MSASLPLPCTYGELGVRTPRSFSRAIPVMATALLLCTGLFGGYVLTHNGNIDALVCAGTERTGSYPYEHIQKGFGKSGYDGQYFYAIARDPWKQWPKGAVGGLDLPAARHARILYPLSAWMITGGHPTNLFWAMPVINLLAIVGIAGLGAGLALKYGRSPWWGLSLPIVANMIMPGFRNLSDPMAFFFATGLICAWVSPKRETGPAAPAHFLWAQAALLTREQSLIFILPLAGIALWQKHWKVAIALSLAIAGWLVWITGVGLAYQSWPFLPGHSNFALPGMGALGQLRAVLNEGSKLQLLILAFGLGLIALQILLGIWLSCRLVWQKRSGVGVILILIGMALALVAGPAIYASPWSYGRVFAILPLGLWLVCLQQRRIMPVLLLCAAGLWPLMVVAQSYLS